MVPCFCALCIHDVLFLGCPWLPIKLYVLQSFITPFPLWCLSRYLLQHLFMANECQSLYSDIYLAVWVPIRLYSPGGQEKYLFHVHIKSPDPSMKPSTDENSKNLGWTSDLRQRESWDWEVRFKFGANPLEHSHFLPPAFSCRTYQIQINTGNSKGKGVTKIHPEDYCGLRSFGVDFICMKLCWLVGCLVGFSTTTRLTHHFLSLSPSSCPQIP